MKGFNAKFKQSIEEMRFRLELSEIEIEDQWCGSSDWPRLFASRQEYDYDCFLDALGPEAEPEQDEEQNAASKKTLIFEYIAGETMEAEHHCPYHIKIELQRSFHLVALVPLFTELQRTIAAAFQDQELDMMYWETIAKGKISRFKNQCNDILEAVEKGEYQHSNISLDVKLNAPVVIIPENIYLTGGNFVKLDTGTIAVSSELKDYQEYQMNKQQMNKSP